MAPFTQEQVNEIYHHIVSQDGEFVAMMAKAALINSADIQCDMWAEREPGVSVPDENDIRNTAISFTEDMLADFKQAFTASIKALDFNLRLRLKHHVAASFK